MEYQRIALRPVFLILEKKDIDQVSWNGTLNEYHLAVPSGQTASFRGILLHAQFLQYPCLFLFSGHWAKIHGEPPAWPAFEKKNPQTGNVGYAASVW
jgi:hypothetical protein